jgi:hypothetical protein
MDDELGDDDDSDLLAAVESAENVAAAATAARSSSSPQPPPVMGFQTGSGKAVVISEDALVKARRLWKEAAEEEEMPVTESIICRMSSGKRVNETLTVFFVYYFCQRDRFPFQIVSSATALAKATQMWNEASQEEDDETMNSSTPPDDTSPIPSCSTPRGDSTAAVAAAAVTPHTQLTAPIKLTPTTSSGMAPSKTFTPGLRRARIQTPISAPALSSARTPVSGLRKRPALGVGSPAFATSSLGASPALPSSAAAAKRPRLVFKAPRINRDQGRNSPTVA